MDVLSGSTSRNLCGLRVRPLEDTQDDSTLKYEVSNADSPVQGLLHLSYLINTTF